MTYWKHSTASINLSLNRNVDARKANSKEKVKSAIHDAVAIGGRNVRVRRNVEEIAMLDFGSEGAEVLPPVMTKLGIDVTKNDLKTQGLKYIWLGSTGSLATMDKWEYSWVQADPSNDFELDKYGTDGWEAVSSVSVFGGSLWRWCTVWVLMKRKVS